MSDKIKYPREEALAVAEMLRDRFYPACSRICVAGSLRRRKPMVGDIEILYIPRFEMRLARDDMFAGVRANLVDDEIEDLIRAGILEKRTNVKGSEMFGAKNKLMRHVPSGIPVDLFSTNEASWFNYLVCRTGPADSNTRIATQARVRGYKWHPYGSGFERLEDGDEIRVLSEQDVFKVVGLPYREPWQRR